MRCKFYFTASDSDQSRVSLIGSSDSAADDLGKLHITFHHNWFGTSCGQRIPSVRYGRVHLYCASANCFLPMPPLKTIKLSIRSCNRESAAMMKGHTYTSQTIGVLATGKVNWDRFESGPSFITYLSLQRYATYCRAAIDALSMFLV
ncbi:MAG: hypothetical protein JSW66_02200 [Phycisphaerales bacterium]|nr:MAG: hypothetical protein JSW66_02200 [Phycisphaerales bacterium]